MENAIIHGLRSIQDGHITVRVAPQGTTLVYTVTDNGPGVDQDDMNRLLVRIGPGNRGFGLKNINDRIQLAYGPEYGLRFANGPAGGAVITVLQPLVWEEEDDPADDR